MCKVHASPAPGNVSTRRSFKILQLPTCNEKGLVRLTIDGKSIDYAYDILRVHPDMGECAVELKKLEPETFPPYHVLIASDGSTSCDCLGFLRWGDRRGRCKHCDVARPLVCQTARLIAERDRAEANAAIVVSKLAVYQQSEQRLVIETPAGKPVASIECASGLTADHVRSANYIASEPRVLDRPESLAANVEQLPETRFALYESLEVEGEDGRQLCWIVSGCGIWQSHHKLANLLRAKPWLLTNPEQVEALAVSIAGTRIIIH